MIRLSVVIPFWNAERSLRTPIESVLRQDFPAEIIAVDDGSTDGGIAIARSYGPRVRVIEKANGGVSTARNAGLAAATGDYVIFLDSDDYFDGPLLRGVADVADAARPDLVLSPGAGELSRGVGETRRGRHVHTHSTAWPTKDALGIAVDIANGHTTPVNAQAWRRDYLVGIGGCRDDVLLRQDTELLLRALLLGVKLGFNLEGLAIWVVRPGQHSLSKRRDEVALRSTHIWHRDHVATLPALHRHAPLLDAYARRSYGLAAMAFESGFRDLGREALALARDCGLAGHVGGRAHRMVAGVIGLEGKMRAAHGWRAFRSAIGLPKKPPRRRAAQPPA